MSGPPTSLSEARAVIATVFTVYYEAIDAWRRDVESAWH
jgi:hypothetical protein